MIALGLFFAAAITVLPGGSLTVNGMPLMGLTAEQPPVDAAVLIRALHDPDPKERRAAVEIAGKSNDPAVTRVLVAAMHDPDESVATAALSTFWETPRAYTADAMEDMLHLIPKVGPRMRRTIVENIAILVSVIGQQRRRERLPTLSPEDSGIIQPLFASDDPRILRAMLSSYFYFNSLPLPPERILGWIAMPDDISIRALPIATSRVKAAEVVSALDERWKNASTTWKLQAVQMGWSAPQYLEWLGRHREPGEVGEMAELTLQMRTGLNPKGMADLRRRLTAPAALRRWAQILPILGRTGGGLALAELKPDGPLTTDVINAWNAYGTAVPPETAAALLGDRRLAVRSFAAGKLRDPTPEQAKSWCGSEFYDVRVLGARFADRSAVEDLLVDERPEVRLAAIVRWATEDWSGLDKILKYGLSDPLLTDNLLVATVRLPQCQAALEAWGAREPQRSKLNSAKSFTNNPFFLSLPVR